MRVDLLLTLCWPVMEVEQWWSFPLPLDRLSIKRLPQIHKTIQNKYLEAPPPPSLVFTSSFAKVKRWRPKTLTVFHPFSPSGSECLLHQCPLQNTASSHCIVHIVPVGLYLHKDIISYSLTGTCSAEFLTSADLGAELLQGWFILGATHVVYHYVWQLGHFYVSLWPQCCSVNWVRLQTRPQLFIQWGN